MKTTPIVVAGLLVALAMAGCSGSSDDTSTSSSVETTSSSSTSRTTTGTTTTSTATTSTGTGGANATTNTTTSAPVVLALKAVAGGPYTGMAYSGIALKGTPSGGNPVTPATCTWASTAGLVTNGPSCTAVFTPANIGDFEVTLTVKRGTEEAKATAKVTASKPVGSAGITCSVYGYNAGGTGVSNIVGIPLGAAGQGNPPYAAGMDISVTARTCDSPDGADKTTPTDFWFIKADGSFVAGPLPMTGGDDGSAFQYGVDYTIPSDASGTYLLCLVVHLATGDIFVTSNQSPDPDGIKAIDVVA